MTIRHQATPPFNSPYQQAIRSSSMLHSTAYPSPARSDTERSKYPVDGLGLYAYSQSFNPSGLPASSVMYPPSPQPTEAWGHLPSGASPLMGEATLHAWTSNYDHAVVRSPASWPTEDASHRSSMSSTGDMSIFSREDPELCFPHVKLEGGSEWASDDGSSPPTIAHSVSMTVSPERLNAGLYSYEQPYESTSLARFESSAPGEAQMNQEFESMPYEERSRSPQENEGPAGPTARTRLRRNPTTAENANYSCHKCGKLFQRSYNHKTHMETHNPTRKKEHKCQHRDCDKQFVRKTDLDRHEKSVHLRRKDFRCAKCDAHFARKDTLRRHEEDGCPKRNELTDPVMLSRNRSTCMGITPSSLGYYNSPRPEVYDTRSPPMFRDDGGFVGTPGGY